MPHSSATAYVEHPFVAQLLAESPAGRDLADPQHERPGRNVQQQDNRDAGRAIRVRRGGGSGCRP